MQPREDRDASSATRPAEPPSRLEAAGVELPLDQDLYDRIVADMERNAGSHTPADLWNPTRLFPDSDATQRSPQFRDLIAPWIGAAAEAYASEELIHACLVFLEEHGARARAPEVPARPTKSDLRTVLDVALIRSYAPHGDRLTVLEVGGGYGRLAEGFLGLATPQVSYLLVDAVPASLYYAHAYLTRRFPEHTIGLYYLDEQPDLSAYDCYVAPVWHLDRLERPLCDVVVNIASMQEMTPEQVQAYLTLFDRSLRPEGVVYLSNTRDYAYGHEYDYPDHWQLVFKKDTPLSWSPHYPVEILLKGDRSWSHENAVLEADYLRDVCRLYRERILELRERERTTVARVRGALEASRAANERLRQANERLRQRLER